MRCPLEILGDDFLRRLTLAGVRANVELEAAPILARRVHPVNFSGGVSRMAHQVLDGRLFDAHLPLIQIVVECDLRAVLLLALPCRCHHLCVGAQTASTALNAVRRRALFAVGLGRAPELAGLAVLGSAIIDPVVV